MMPVPALEDMKGKPVSLKTWQMWQYLPVTLGEDGGALQMIGAQLDVFTEKLNVVTDFASASQTIESFSGHTRG